MTKTINCPRCGTPATFWTRSLVRADPYCPNCGWGRARVAEELHKAGKLDLGPIVFLVGASILFGWLNPAVGVFMFVVVGGVHFLEIIWARHHLRKLRAEPLPTAVSAPSVGVQHVNAVVSGKRTVALRRKGKEILGAALVIALFALVMFGLGSATLGGRLLLIVACVAIFVATWLTVRAARRHKRLTAEGAVALAHVKRQWMGGHRGRLHMIEYEFSDAAGQLVESQTDDWTGSLYEEMTVLVFYNPRNSSDHLLAPFSYYEVV